MAEPTYVRLLLLVIEYLGSITCGPATVGTTNSAGLDSLTPWNAELLTLNIAGVMAAQGLLRGMNAKSNTELADERLQPLHLLTFAHRPW